MSLCVTLIFALWLLHPGPFQLITLASNVLMTYFADSFNGLYDR